MFQDKVVVITGGAGGIGKCIAEEFEKAGAKVCVIDVMENEYFVGDVGDKITLEKFVQKVIKPPQNSKTSSCHTLPYCWCFSYHF